MYISTVKYLDIANGLGIRTSVFVSGCTHYCKGCFNKQAWDFYHGTEYTMQMQEEILESLEADYIAGLSLLGGEPMELVNQEGLILLLRALKQRFPQKNIWCYTGYTYPTDFLPGGRAYGTFTKEMLDFIDVLVDGEFVEELYDISLKFRGSSNQRVIDVKKSQKAGKIILLAL